MLHIYDPKAMHSIYVKDQDNYYRGEKAVGYVVQRHAPRSIFDVRIARYACSLVQGSWERMAPSTRSNARCLIRCSRGRTCAI